jgi:uroporphyrinogen III methyltransferase/synthase
VGKQPTKHRLSQDEINALIVEHALAGRLVVRLKGGDPFVFGRGSEEALVCAEAGIPFEVVPGVSSAFAVPAYAGIPLTHRQVSSAFTVITGHEDPTQADAPNRLNYAALAQQGGTLVVLMGRSNLSPLLSNSSCTGNHPTPPPPLWNGDVPLTSAP